jgi:hypothetical protein
MPAPKGWDIVGFFNAPPAAGLPPSDTLPFAMLLKVRQKGLKSSFSNHGATFAVVCFVSKTFAGKSTQLT